MAVTEKRIRINAKQTSKNLWYLDVTVEVSGEGVTSADVDVLEAIKNKETEFREDERKLVTDEIS